MAVWWFWFACFARNVLAKLALIFPILPFLRVFTSFGSADLSKLWWSLGLRRGEKGACVLQPAAKGHLADLAVCPVAAHFPLAVWQHLRHGCPPCVEEKLDLKQKRVVLGTDVDPVSAVCALDQVRVLGPGVATGSLDSDAAVEGAGELCSPLLLADVC